MRINNINKLAIWLVSGAIFNLLLMLQGCNRHKNDASFNHSKDPSLNDRPDTTIEDSIWISINDSTGFYLSDNEETRLKMSSWEAIKRFKENNLEEYSYNSLDDTTTYPIGSYLSRSGKPTQYEYTYALAGKDRNGREAKAEVTVQGKFGSGWVLTDGGHRLSLRVYWGKDGLLHGTDIHQMDYIFKP
ncbi:hypothetical protein [Dyadobacter tibetensis]|uniref:hypothetical protein n=1 Tax=Dyadobacter tibetensis TaxID=1211851 RepID=UPI0004708111|nr:hypothetical protein [Dyadobacter tibetensis]